MLKIGCCGFPVARARYGAELGPMHCADPLKAGPVTAGTAYFRLHGATGYRYRHTDDDLRRLLGLAAGCGETYCLFNNMTMLEDARRLKALAARSGAATA